MIINGNTFIVTGGTGGIGSGAAGMLLREGGSVALFDMMPQEKGQAVADRLVAELEPAGGTNGHAANGNGNGVVGAPRAIYVRANITDEAAVKAAVDVVVAELGNLKGVVHCAGVAIKREWTNDAAESIPDFRTMLDINVTGTFIVNAVVADAINYPLNHPDGPDTHAPFWTTDEERGVIVNFASAAANPYARVLGYGPGKMAVIGITKAMADFLGPSGIRVVSISPSIVLSGMTAGFSTYFADALLKHATFPRTPLTPAHMASTIKWIIENDGVNAVDVPVDGGWKLVMEKPGVAGGADPRALAPGLE